MKKDLEQYKALYEKLTNECDRELIAWYKKYPFDLCKISMERVLPFIYTPIEEEIRSNGKTVEGKFMELEKRIEVLEEGD